MTALVSGWVEGSYPNHGLMLLAPGLAQDVYQSSEYAVIDKHPWLEVCYVAP